jgi:competence protein ComEC
MVRAGDLLHIIKPLMRHRFYQQLFFITLVLSLIVCGCICHPKSTPTVNPSPSFSAQGIPSNGILTVHFIDVGQGDSMLVQVNNRSMLIDGGPRKSGVTLVSYLKNHGVKALDYIVSTHPHADHIGGLLAVLRLFPVGQVIDSGQPHATQTYEQYLTLIDRKNIPYMVPEAGQHIDLGPGVCAEVLGPVGNESGGSLNENSIVVKLSYHNVSFLFMGDAGFPEERAIMATGADLRSDVLKVPHHGSKYSSSARFLTKVKPEVSVIEVGENNYGHPSPKTLARYQKIGSVVYRTDINGNVVVTTNGNSFTVTPEHPASVGSKAFAGTSPWEACTASALSYAIMFSYGECTA